MKNFPAIVAGLSLAGCAPSAPFLVIAPGAEEAQKPNPPSEVTDAAAVTPRDGTGAIVITSQRVWFGKRCTFDVVLDDRHVAGLRPGEQVTLYAAPGTRVVNLSVRDEGSCEPATAQVSLDVVAHATKTIQLDSDRRHDLKVDVNTYGGSLSD